jgi:hypothetical protein
VLTIKQYGAALAKICRYAGRGKFCSDLLHCFVVADLVEDEFKLDALLHDITEVLTGDVNSNYKSSSMRAAEHRLLDDIYDDLGLRHITNRAHRVVKVADLRSRNGEIHSGIGDPLLKKTYPLRDRDAERLHLVYFRKYPVTDLMNPNGKAVKEFCRRFKSYKKLQ